MLNSGFKGKSGLTWKVLVFIIIQSLLLSSCQKPSENHIEGVTRIVATTGMIRDAVKRICGSHAEVSGLMGPGVDPHLYKASFGDLRKLRKADIIVYNGLHLEGKMTDVFEKISRQKKTILLSDGLTENQLRQTSQFGGSHDPHIWFNVGLWRNAVKHTGNELIAADSLHQRELTKNLDQYLTELDSLDLWVKKQIASIPEKKRVLITAHDAFGYFGDAYNIEVRGLQGISTLADFGLNDISSLVQLITTRKIKAVFIESSVPRKAIEAVVEGCRSKGHEVRIGGTLYSDALGQEGTPEGTYIGMVRYNVNTIVNALK